MEYFYDRKITPEQFLDVLKRSTLAERRPVDEYDRICQMLANANITATAWDGDLLIGVARSVTDFSYCCYLSDLAVDEAYQKRGIGKRLIELTRSRLHPKCKLILLSAPKAQSYYPHIGFSQHPSAWVLG
jgi:GNAT superfamily N-acetyltransferase